MTEPLLTRRRMLDAFGRLADRLSAEQVVADVHIVRGAVMVTEYDARDSTADVDAIDSHPYRAVMRAAAAVAADMELPSSWLNQNASAYAPTGPDWRRSSVFDHPNLHLYVIAPEQLLAMKVRAGRPTDADDIATLCEILGVVSVDEVIELVGAAFPGEDLPARGIALVWDVLGAT